MSTCFWRCHESEVKWILWREESIWGGNLSDLNPQRNYRHLVNKGQGILKWWKLVLKPLTISFFLLQHSWSFSSITQIWDLSTISHRRILRPKILNPYSPSFNSFGDKNTKKWVKMETFTPLAKILHCRRQGRQWQISPLQLRKHILRWHCWRSVRNIAFLFLRYLSIWGSNFPPYFFFFKKVHKVAQKKVTDLEGNTRKSEKAHLRLYYQR